MITEESAQKAVRPQLVKLDKALKLAEKWVSKMTKSVDDESAELQLEGRPLRLGLGATVPRRSKVGPLSDPVERKLHAKLKAVKGKATDDSKPSSGDIYEDKEDDDSDENLDSRTNVFSKKRVMPLASALHSKKRK